MIFLNMKKDESVQVFLARVNTLRRKSERHGVGTDDFHFRGHVEAAMQKKQATIAVAGALASAASASSAASTASAASASASSAAGGAAPHTC